LLRACFHVLVQLVNDLYKDKMVGLVHPYLKVN